MRTALCGGDKIDRKPENKNLVVKMGVLMLFY